MPYISPEDRFLRDAKVYLHDDFKTPKAEIKRNKAHNVVLILLKVLMVRLMTDKIPAGLLFEEIRKHQKSRRVGEFEDMYTDVLCNSKHVYGWSWIERNTGFRQWPMFLALPPYNQIKISLGMNRYFSFSTNEPKLLPERRQLPSLEELCKLADKEPPPVPEFVSDGPEYYSCRSSDSISSSWMQYRTDEENMEHNEMHNQIKFLGFTDDWENDAVHRDPPAVPESTGSKSPGPPCSSIPDSRLSEHDSYSSDRAELAPLTEFSRLSLRPGHEEQLDSRSDYNSAQHYPCTDFDCQSFCPKTSPPFPSSPRNSPDQSQDLGYSRYAPEPVEDCRQLRAQDVDPYRNELQLEEYCCQPQMSEYNASADHHPSHVGHRLESVIPQNFEQYSQRNVQYERQMLSTFAHDAHSLDDHGQTASDFHSYGYHSRPVQHSCHQNDANASRWYVNQHHRNSSSPEWSGERHYPAVQSYAVSNFSPPESRYSNFNQPMYEARVMEDCREPPGPEFSDRSCCTCSNEQQFQQTWDQSDRYALRHPMDERPITHDQYSVSSGIGHPSVYIGYRHDHQVPQNTEHESRYPENHYPYPEPINPFAGRPYNEHVAESQYFQEQPAPHRANQPHQQQGQNYPEPSSSPSYNDYRQ
ncbi:unnamed protein product [Caenorhabditis sp. 36 PRJEB53466]|nr:unnamed protein product [Caenorhabditis sp. 36 PRJEB53466]